MTLYRVSVLDSHGNVAHSRTAGSIVGVAALLHGLGQCTSDEWAKPLLDQYGELTVSVRREGGRQLLDSEQAYLSARLRELDVRQPETDEEIGLLRWGNPERQM